ncbi:phage major capsid protein [Amycolatopsis dongchuanensis]|uniref:Phage capsid-like C-terminal domain-containing protein n=1 Tax=Amycolatopsis dongchuanensis TaxID=1070866 RepID=A0ABP9Q7Z7_9PSEU
MTVVPDNTAWYPQDHGALIDNAVKNQAIAAKVLTPVTCAGHTMGFPVLEADPDVSWYAPGAEISLTDPETSELIVTPKAVKGLTKIANESIADSNPATAEVVGRGLARQIVEKIDNALFAASAPANGPQGLPLHTPTTVQVQGGLTALTDEDPFVTAKFTALELGAELSAFVLATDVAMSLATVKVATGDARRLLDSDDEGNLRIAGLPAYVSRHVAAGEAYGLDRSQNYLVIRQGTSVETDRSGAFTSDSTLVRAVMRAEFAITNPAGVVRLVPAGS